MAPRSRYKEGESVLAFQGVLIYEAKILGVQRQGAGFVYDIHYKGWNKTWDEQVLEDRLLKLTEENLVKQREAEEELRAKKAARPGINKPAIVDKDSSEANSNLNKKESLRSDVVPTESSAAASSCVKEEQIKPKISTIRILKEGAVKPSIEGPPKLVRSTSKVGKEIPSKTLNATVPKRGKEQNSNKSNETVSKNKPENPKIIKKTASKSIKDSAAAAKSTKRPHYESVEVRLEVIPKVKKTRSRSNSDASVISVHSTKSTDGSKSVKTRPVKPKAVLKSATEVPKAMKKIKKKIKPNENPSSPAKPLKILKNRASFKSEGETKKKIFGSEVEIILSEDLKIILVDDLDYIGRQRKLLNLPSRYNVDDLVQDYIKWLGRGQKDAASNIFETDEVCKGLRDYFNSTLGSQLLYKFERVQYSDILKEHPGVLMSQLYGPVHLLRLLTKLGPMLCSVPLGEEAIDKLVGQVNMLIEYLTNHREDLFQRQDYGTATPEYHRRAL